MGTEFWKQHALEHQTPKDMDNPEGWDVKYFLACLTLGKTVLDLGCGRGRLAAAFPPDHYLGLDVSWDAITAAREAQPLYQFDVVGEELPQTDVTLIYTVCLHVHDDAIGHFLGRLKSPQVIIAEILGRENRNHYEKNDGEVIEPIHNRDREDFINLMAAQDYVLIDEFHQPYFWYEGKLISFLIFQR